MNFVWIATLLLSASLCVAGCHKKPKHEEGPMESAGEEMDEAGHEVKEETKDAVDDTGDAVEEAGDNVEDKTDD